MDRREMLEESFRGIGRMLPKVFGVIGGFDRLITNLSPCEPVDCFPDPDDVPDVKTTE